jgi:hypothetical protein
MGMLADADTSVASGRARGARTGLLCGTLGTTLSMSTAAPVNLGVSVPGALFLIRLVGLDELETGSLSRRNALAFSLLVLAREGPEVAGESRA